MRGNSWFVAAFATLFVCLGWAMVFPGATVMTWQGFVLGVLELLVLILVLVGWWRR